MKNFDFGHFNFGHWFFAAQRVMLAMPLIAGLAHRPLDGFLTLLVLVTGTSLYGRSLSHIPEPTVPTGGWERRVGRVGAKTCVLRWRLSTQFGLT